MITQVRPLNEITVEAIHILCREIGLVNTIRFINQFTTGYGDYTEEREKLFNDMSLSDIITEIKKTRRQQNT
jgi:hypothetical protein